MAGMARLVDEALGAIADGDPGVAAEGIRLAASFFEHAHGRAEGLGRAGVTADPADPADLSRLRDRLVGLVRAGPPAPVAGAAVFALGKLHDPALTGFFIDVVRRYLCGDTCAAMRASCTRR